MSTQFRIAIAAAALMAGLSFAGASRANAGVSFRGTFPLPHGSISIGIGDPTFGVGAFVPYGYIVENDPEYGYGFYYGDSWIPCRPYQSRWVVCDRPFHDTYAGGAYIGGGYGYRSYGGYHGQPSCHRDYDRGYYDRDYGRGYYDRDWDRGHASSRGRDHDHGGYGGHRGEGHGHDGGHGHGHERD